MMAGISLLAAPMLLVTSLTLEHQQMASLATALPIHWGGVGLLAAGGFTLAYSIWYGLLERYRVDQVTPFALLMPPLGVAASYLLLGERISLPATVGGVIIVMGLGIVVRGPLPKWIGVTVRRLDEKDSRRRA